MSEREDVESLARIVDDALFEHDVQPLDGSPGVLICGRCGTGFEDTATAHRTHAVATAALAWMRERESVETAEELAALPVGSVVLDLGPSRGESAAPVVACKAARGDWQVLGDDPERRWRSSEIADVARSNVLRVVYRPETREGE